MREISLRMTVNSVTEGYIIAFYKASQRVFCCLIEFDSNTPFCHIQEFHSSLFEADIEFYVCRAKRIALMMEE